jgi:hypothetical protein
MAILSVPTDSAASGWQTVKKWQVSTHMRTALESSQEMTE